MRRGVVALGASGDALKPMRPTTECPTYANTRWWKASRGNAQVARNTKAMATITTHTNLENASSTCNSHDFPASGVGANIHASPRRQRPGIQQPTSRRNCQVGPTFELEMKQQQHQLHQRRPLPPRPRLALMAAARPTLQVQNLELRELAEDPIRSHAYAARSETVRLERQRGSIGLDLTLGHRCVRCRLALPRPFSASYANYIYDGGTLA